MTFDWFVIWLIANNVGGSEPLELDPVNILAGSLILPSPSISIGPGPSWDEGRADQRLHGWRAAFGTLIRA